MFNTEVAYKSADQLGCVVTDMLKHGMVIRSDDISIHTVKSDNEAALPLACGFLTNIVGSVRCVTYTLVLCVDNVFTESSPWKEYMNNISKETSYFNYHGKENIMISEKQ